MSSSPQLGGRGRVSQHISLSSCVGKVRELDVDGFEGYFPFQHSLIGFIYRKTEDNVKTMMQDMAKAEPAHCPAGRGQERYGYSQREAEEIESAPRKPRMRHSSRHLLLSIVT